MGSTNPNGSKEFSLSKASLRSSGGVAYLSGLKLNRHGGKSVTGPGAFLPASAARGPEERTGPAAAAAQAVVNLNISCTWIISYRSGYSLYKSCTGKRN